MVYVPIGYSCPRLTEMDAVHGGSPWGAGYLAGGDGSRPVSELIALLSLVANPHDDEAVISALTSPACGAGPDGLWKVREEAGAHQPLWNGVAAIARRAVDVYAGMEPGRPVGGTYYLYRVLRQLDVDGVIEALLEELGAGLPPLQECCRPKQRLHHLYH